MYNDTTPRALRDWRHTVDVSGTPLPKHEGLHRLPDISVGPVLTQNVGGIADAWNVEEGNHS
jgi:hypothetical protein